MKATKTNGMAMRLRALKRWVEETTRAWGQDRTAAGLQRAEFAARGCTCEGCRG